MTLRIKWLTIERLIDLIGNSCLYLFLFLTTYIFLFRYEHALFIIRFVFLAIGALIGYSKCLLGRKHFQNAILFMLGMTSFWVLSYLGQNGYTNYTASDFLYTICYIGISTLILQNTYNHYIALGLFGITSVSILIRIFQGIDKDHILLANSRNYISILLLSTMLLYYVSCHDKKKPVLLTPVLVFFIINIFATGRSGIIVSGLMTIGIMFYKINSIENRGNKRLIGAGIALVFLVTVLLFWGIDEQAKDQFFHLNFSSFISRKLDSNGRNEIWNAFLQNNCKSLGSLLFGSDTSLAMHDGNLHSSFLQCYASFGLMGFIVILYFSSKAIINGIINKDYLWIVLFTSLLLRAATDRVFFQGYCELYLYYFIFYYAYHGRLKNQKSNLIQGDAHV